MPEGPAWLIAIAIIAGVLTVGAKAVVSIVHALADRKAQPVNGWKDRMATVEQEVAHLRKWRHDEVAQRLTELLFEKEIAKERIADLETTVRELRGKR